MKALVAVFLLLLAIASAGQDIHLDGVLTPDEWKGAQQFKIDGGGTVAIRNAGKLLYVGLSSPERCWSHVYLLSRDTVHVFHASAALGQVVYVQHGDVWDPIGAFNYTLRGRIYNDTLQKEQAEYRIKHGWTANNNNTGDGKTLEFCFDMDRWKDSAVRMTFVFMSDVKKPLFFPSTLKDDTLKEELLYGGPPPGGLKFATDNWWTAK